VTRADITVGERDEDGLCAVTVTRDGHTEYLHIRHDEVGLFVESEREVEDMAEAAAARGQSLCEYALAPFGPEWQREQEERR